MEAMEEHGPEEADIDQRVRDNVRTLLGVNGLRDSDLARHLRVHRATVSGKLTGASRFTLTEAWKMAQFFDVPLDVLAMEPGKLRAQVRAAVGSRTGSSKTRAAANKIPAAAREARHLTPVVSSTPGFSDPCDPPMLPLRPVLRAVT